MDFLRILAAIFIPPLGVYLQVGVTGHFWLNIVLTMLGYIPGIVHAVWVIRAKENPPAARPERETVGPRS